MLTILQQLPDGLLDLPAASLHEVLPGPTLIHLSGRRPRPLFVSVLMHGNEDTGWLALRDVLREHQGRELPRALSIFIGNVGAARYGLRRLDGQLDYNRIWKNGDRPEHGMARQVLDEMRRLQVFAAVDVHNNTGFNPHYACVNVLDQRYLHLAVLFSRTVVYFIKPDTVSSMAFASLCPAVTLECGQPGQAHGEQHAREYLNACLHLAELPTHAVVEHDIDLFHTVATVRIPDHVDFGFDRGCGELCLAPDLDHLNFRELPAGTSLGWSGNDEPTMLEAWDESGNQVAQRYFRVVDGEIRTAVPVMPSMFTLNKQVIRQDCLGYLMERYRAPGPRN